MADEVAPWGFGRKDGVYAMALLAVFGGERALDHNSSASIEVLTEKVSSLERNVGQLQSPGGPVLRETVVRISAAESKIRDLEHDVRGGVSRDAIDALKQQVADSKESDRQFLQQLSEIRNSVDAVRLELQRLATARLIGPNR